MKKRFALSVAMIAALSIVAAPTVTAQDEAEADEAENIYALDLLDQADFGVVRNSEEVAGQPISHWVRQADEWFLKQPFDEHYGPQNDCQAFQEGPVFNLQNVPFGMQMLFECEIGPDQHILITPGGGIGISTEPGDTPELMYADAIDNGLWITEPKINVDGTDIPVGGSTWYQGEVFTFDMPAGNILDVEPGEHLVVTNGWYVMLEPLEPGEHTIAISDKWLGPAIAPWDVDGTGQVGEEFTPIGAGVTATALFDITVPGDEAAAE